MEVSNKLNIREILKKGDLVEVKTVDWTLDGRAVCKYEGFPIFVKAAIGSDLSLVKITRVKKSFAEAILVKSLIKSDKLVENEFDTRPLINSYPFINIKKEHQFKWKKAMVEGQLKRLGGIEADVEFHAYSHFAYRNKVNLRLDQEGYLSYSKQGTNSLIKIENDPMAILPIQKMIKLWQVNFPKSLKSEPFDVKKIRMVIFRANRRGEGMLILVTAQLSKSERKILFKLCNFLNVKVLCTCENRRAADISLNGNFYFDTEKTYLDEHIMDLSLRLSPQSFLQVNVFSIEDLYNKALDLLGKVSGKRVLDLYCGTGITSLLLEKRGACVLGIELVNEAIKDAEKNAEVNGCRNIKFISGRVEKLLKENKELNSDLALVDPPEKGMEEEAINSIIASDIKRLVYVSCNPSTLSRDCKRLVEAGFNVIEVHGYDQFFCTGHVEVIALLAKE